MITYLTVAGKPSFCDMQIIYAFCCRSETQNSPPFSLNIHSGAMILDIRINKFHSEFDKTKNISQCNRGLLKNKNEIALFSFRTLKTLCESSAICVKSFRCQFLFTFGKSLALKIYRTRVFWHIRGAKQLTALNKSFSVHNNIYCDTHCFAYYICTYLRDKWHA